MPPLLGGASQIAPASDRSRLESVLRLEKQSGLCSADVATIAALVDRADDKRFESTVYHVLNNLMPDETVCSYELTHRRHNRELINKTSLALFSV